MNSFNITEMEIIRLAEARQVIPSSSVTDQTIKMFGQVSDILYNQNNTDGLKNAFGELLSTLIISAALADVDLKECLSLAHERSIKTC
jgi:hypothetical protein